MVLMNITRVARSPSPQNGKRKGFCITVIRVSRKGGVTILAGPVLIGMRFGEAL